MPCYRIDIVGPVAHLVCKRPLGLADWKAALSALTTHEKFAAGNYLLVTQQNRPDVCGLDAEILDAASMLLSRYIPPLGNRVALVAAEDFQYGLGRMLEAFCGSRGVNLRVYRAISEARQWLTGYPATSNNGVGSCATG